MQSWGGTFLTNIVQCHDKDLHLVFRLGRVAVRAIWVFRFMTWGRRFLRLSTWWFIRNGRTDQMVKAGLRMTWTLRSCFRWFLFLVLFKGWGFICSDSLSSDFPRLTDEFLLLTFPVVIWSSSPLKCLYLILEISANFITDPFPVSTIVISRLFGKRFHSGPLSPTTGRISSGSATIV